MDRLDRELEVARAAAREAGAAIMRFYGNAEVEVHSKPDLSPVTAADEAANVCLIEKIRGAFPEDGFLSEESPDDESRLGKRRVWIVDPLDGTRDFLAQTGDFCVLVGLTIDGAPVLGVAYQPVKDALYFACRGKGAFVEVDGATRPLGASRAQLPSEVRVGISRLNPDEGLGKCLAAAGLAARAVQMGASAKHMALARGEIDAVLNLSAAEMEWDTCAPEVILTEAGCTGHRRRRQSVPLQPARSVPASRQRREQRQVSHAHVAGHGALSARTDGLDSRRFEDPEQQHQAGDQHGQPGGERDQQQALRARAGRGALHGHVGDDQIRVLSQRPAEQDQHRLRRHGHARQTEAAGRERGDRRQRGGAGEQVERPAPAPRGQRGTDARRAVAGENEGDQRGHADGDGRGQRPTAEVLAQRRVATSRR